MEDVLDVYQRPYDPKRPMVCMDETSKQLLGETRPPVAAAPGRVARHDYEYVRNGVANLFMCFEPLASRLEVKVTARRTKVDWARSVRELVDEHYPHAERVVLVLDNLNTHTPASLYEAFPPAEAKRIAQRLEIHYTPKHGSWLNMAEIELSVLERQCLDRRLGTFEALSTAATTWAEERNQRSRIVDWRFTTDDARIKLKQLYPSLQS